VREKTDKCWSLERANHFEIRESSERGNFQGCCGFPYGVHLKRRHQLLSNQNANGGTALYVLQPQHFAIAEVTLIHSGCGRNVTVEHLNPDTRMSGETFPASLLGFIWSLPYCLATSLGKDGRYHPMHAIIGSAFDSLTTLTCICSSKVAWGW
jgi:hypothetical protein